MSKDSKDIKDGTKLGVWLSYRAVGHNTVHRLFMSGVQANRVIRRFNTKHYKGRLDVLQVTGAYQEKIKASPITTLRGSTPSETRKAGRYIPEGITKRTIRETFKYMAFHANKLDNAVLVFCPITGICGSLEMPALPIALVYHHPLSIAQNALSVVSALAEQVKDKSDKALKAYESQILAGCLLSMLRKKHLIREDAGETTAAEQNMVLQQAGIKTLYTLCNSMVRLWDNPNVWNKVPSLNVDWNVHAAIGYGGVNIQQTLQSFNVLLWQTLEPLAMSAEDQARYLTAKRERKEWLGHGRPPSYIKIHSASAVQARTIKDNRVQARTMLGNIGHMLPVVLRALIGKVIKDLLILPQDSKEDAATKLEAASDTLPALQAATALELADLIRTSKNERILDEIGSFMQEVSPKPIKSIAEILEAKRLKREEGGQSE